MKKDQKFQQFITVSSLNKQLTLSHSLLQQLALMPLRATALAAFIGKKCEGLMEVLFPEKEGRGREGKHFAHEQCEQREDGRRTLALQFPRLRVSPQNGNILKLIFSFSSLIVVILQHQQTHAAVQEHFRPLAHHLSQLSTPTLLTLALGVPQSQRHHKSDCFKSSIELGIPLRMSQGGLQIIKDELKRIKEKQLLSVRFNNYLLAALISSHVEQLNISGQLDLSITWYRLVSEIYKNSFNLATMAYVEYLSKSELFREREVEEERLNELLLRANYVCIKKYAEISKPQMEKMDTQISQRLVAFLAHKDQQLRKINRHKTHPHPQRLPELLKSFRQGHHTLQEVCQLIELNAKQKQLATQVIIPKIKEILNAKQSLVSSRAVRNQVEMKDIEIVSLKAKIKELAKPHQQLLTQMSRNEELERRLTRQQQKLSELSQGRRQASATRRCCLY